MADPVSEPITFPTMASESDPRGRRYDLAEKEAAYQAWRVSRSLRQAADATGISVGTLQSWHSREQWTERAEADEADAAKIVRAHIVGRVVGEIGTSIDTLIEIRDNKDASNRDRLQAAVALLSLGGLNPNAKQSDTATAKPAPSFVPNDLDNEPLTPDSAYQRQLARRERLRNAG